MIEMLRGALGIVVLLGLAILFHEFGHFIWAKIFGVRVLKFSLGFGKFIVSRKWGETEYGIAWFPIGGYVMLHGAMNPETGEPIDESDMDAKPTGEKPEDVATRSNAPDTGAGKSAAPQTPSAPATPASGGDGAKSGHVKRMVDLATSDSTALYNKPYLAKLAIYSGGVAMNWITAVATIGLIYAIGFSAPKPAASIVGEVELPKGVAAEVIPIQPGDRIVRADGKAVGDWDEFLDAMGAAWDRLEKTGKPKTVDVVVDRPGSGETTVTLATVIQVEGKPRSPASFLMSDRPAYVEDTIPNKPADKAGIRQGDTVLSINGQLVHTWRDLSAIIRANAKKPLGFVVKRGEETLSMTVVPVENPDVEDQGQIGIVAGSSEREIVKEPVLTAFKKAPGRTVDMTVTYVKLFGGVIERLVNLKFRAVGDQLGGPIQIAQMAYRSAKRGLIDFLWLFFSFNIALAVFNILPIPLLDGSLLFFATWEAIFRRPFPPKLHIPLLYAGLVLIAILFVAVSINDVWRVFG